MCKKEKIMDKIEEMISKDEIVINSNHTAVISEKNNEKIFITVFNKALINSSDVYILIQNDNNEFVSVQKQNLSSVSQKILEVNIKADDFCGYLRKNNAASSDFRIAVCYETNDGLCFKYLWNDRIKKKTERDTENQKISDVYSFISDDKNYSSYPFYGEKSMLCLHICDDTFSFFQKGAFKLNSCVSDDFGNVKLEISKNGRIAEICGLYAFRTGSSECIELPLHSINNETAVSDISAALFSPGEWNVCGKFISDDTTAYGGIKTSNAFSRISVKSELQNKINLVSSETGMLKIICLSTLKGISASNKQFLSDNMYFPEDFLLSEESLPKGRCRAEMSVNQENSIDFRLFENFRFADELKIVFYDTKNNRPLFEKTAQYISDDCIRITYDEAELSVLENPEDMCIRICLGAFSKNFVYYLYLVRLNEKITDGGKSRYIKPVHVYNSAVDRQKYLCNPFYDKNGLLSIRRIKENKKYLDVVINDVTALSVNQDSIHIEIKCVNMGSPYKCIAIAPKRGINDIPSDILITAECSISENNGFSFISADIQLSELSPAPDLYDVYCQLQDGSLISVKAEPEFIRNFRNQEHKSCYLSGENQLYAFTMFNNTGHLILRCSESPYEYAVSIIMAVYNTELFIEEAVDSIINQQLDSISDFCACLEHKSYQDIRFSEPVQVILVDDGALDNSGKICDAYAEKYDFITAVHKPNGGVSSARNKGLEYAKGKYLNFIDSDDKFKEDALSKMFTYFEANYNKMEIATMPIVFFDAASGNHWLNEKFKKGNRIIDLRSEYNSSLLFVNASFFKAELVMPDLRFDETLVTGEDSKFIYTIFLRNNCRFGLVADTEYRYRRRSKGEDSAIQASKLNRNFYFDYLDGFIDWIAAYSKELNGFIPKYVQYVIAQQLQWRFVQDKDAAIAKSVLTDDEFEQYKQHLFNELHFVDDDILLMQKMIFREQKLYMLMKKYNTLPSCEYFDDDATLYYGNSVIGLLSSCYTKIDFINIHNDILTIEGYTMIHGCENPYDTKVFISASSENENTMTECEINHKRDQSVYSLGEPIFHSLCFRCTVPLDKLKNKYQFGLFVDFNNHMIQKKDIRFNKFSPINTVYDNSYYAENGWVIKYSKPYLTAVNLFSESSSENLTDYEEQFEKAVERKDKNNKRIMNALKLREKFFAYQSIYHKKKDIWLISDRVNLAGDNGEAFFLYMLEKNDPDIDFYFVINENCPDYYRLSKYGKVVIQNSQQHKFLHLMADVIVSAHANEYVIDPFFNDGTTNIFRDIVFRPKYVFLQHGVIKDDLSDWLNRFKKNISGFITAAHPEYQSILDYTYFYTEKETWLTGLPRHDRLYHDEKNYITIMPTWRKYLTDPNDDSMLADDFTSSDFFNFYNALINNEKLISAAKKNNYQLCFMPHPNIMQHLDLFDHNENVLFFGTEKPYREIYAQSNLVMTDFSSSIMDFAYLRKPVVYCQFDKERFFDGEHVYVQGYYDYERDGFGEVTYTLDDIVDVMISYMENNCQLKSIYRQRMDSFFAYNDKKNCERVYLKIKDMLSEDKKNN